MRDICAKCKPFSPTSRPGGGGPVKKWGERSPNSTCRSRRNPETGIHKAQHVQKYRAYSDVIWKLSSVPNRMCLKVFLQGNVGRDAKKTLVSP